MNGAEDAQALGRQGGRVDPKRKTFERISPWRRQTFAVAGEAR